MPDLSQDEQRRYSWYARFMQQAGAAPKSFEEWRGLFNQQRIDVSPQGTDRDNGPVMSGELAKNATGEATYEIQRQATNPWEGFWESFFNAARGGSPEVQNDPLQETHDEQVTEAPVAEVQSDPLPTPKVQNDPLVTTLSEIMDQYVQKQRTIQEWTQDLDRALRRQSLAKGFDATGDRGDLVRQLGDALDHEMLVAQLTDMLDVRSSSYAADEAIDLGAEPDRYPEQDQYAALSWNPIMHPRGNAANPGQFTKKIGVDPDAMSSPEPGGPGMESDDPQQMPVAPPLPPASASVARVDLPDEINNKVQELAAHIPDYLLDGEGRTKDAHITIKMLADDDPRQIAPLLQDEAPFRAVLGQVTVVDATEARPFDVVAIKVHSSALHRLHRKLSQALDGMQAHNGYSPYLRVADVQPGTADKWIGWAGLEGESVVVDSLTFVNRNHEPHKIPLQGQKGEYQLDRPEQYAAKQLSMFDAPVQNQPRAAAPMPTKTSTPLLTPSAAQSTAVQPASRPLYKPPVAGADRPLFAPKSATAAPKPFESRSTLPPLEPPPPSSTDYTPDEMSQIQREVEALANEISEARRTWKPPEESFVDDANEQETNNEFTDGDRPVRDESEYRPESDAGSQPGGMESGRTGSFSDRGTGGPRGIKTARAEFMPQGIDTSIVPASIRGLLRPMQVEDSAMAIQAMTKHGGFLNASGTGSGKSWSTMATAKYWTDNNHKVLIVTPNEAINPDYETGQYTGAFRSAGKAMNINPVLNGGTKPMKPGEIHITTYHRFHDLESQVDENTIIMWDESHLLKNQASNRSQTGDRMNQKAKAVLYATATPADKPVHIAHLFRAKVFGNRSPEKTYRELGLAPFDEKQDDGTLRQSWRIDPDIGPIEVYRRLNGLFNQMTKEGLMVKRDLDMTGMTIYLKHLDLPQKANDVLTHIEMEASNGMGVHSLQGLAKGRLLMDLRRQQEPFKVPYLTELIKHELKDTGRQVVVYTGRVNPSAVIRGGEQIFSSSGTPKLIKQQLETHFPAKIGELHGGSDNPPAVSMRNFQDGHTNTLIATMERGGIGIDLDDQHGDKPRTMIILTAPFAGDRNAQMLGRIWRDSTRTPHGHTNAIYLFANTDIDHWNRDLIAGKMRTLGAVVQGAARDLEIPFDVGEEGLMDLAKQNQSERERHRDMVARGLLKQPYEWRQLSGLPPEEQPVVQPQLAAEGIEELRPGQAGYKQKVASKGRGRGLSPIGHKKTAPSALGQQSMFTQDGTPDRYEHDFEDEVSLVSEKYSMSQTETRELMNRYCAEIAGPAPHDLNHDLQQLAREMNLSPGEIDAIRQQYNERVASGS